jgi:hypothetical protein
MDMSSNDAHAPSSRKKSSFRSLDMGFPPFRKGELKNNAIISLRREMARE